MPDWQLTTVLILVAGAAVFLALRMVRFFSTRRRSSSSCGSTCHGCGQPASSNPIIPLEPPNPSHRLK
jgi:hypothetical protein